MYNVIWLVLIFYDYYNCFIRLEIEHLLKPVTYDLPNHTVTVSEIPDWNSSVPVTSDLHSAPDDLQLPSKSNKNDEVEKYDLYERIFSEMIKI